LAVSTHGEWEPWFVYFCQGVEQEANQAISMLEKIDRIRADYRDKLKKSKSSERAYRLVDELLGDPTMTIDRLGSLFSITFPTAKRMISEFEQLGILEEVTGGKRNRIYLATAVLDVFKTRHHA
jgi:Fic family protein